MDKLLTFVEVIENLKGREVYELQTDISPWDGVDIVAVRTPSGSVAFKFNGNKFPTVSDAEGNQKYKSCNQIVPIIGAVTGGKYKFIERLA